MTFYSADPVRFYGVSHVTDTLSSKHPEVGARMSVGDEDYIWVYNTGANAQIPPGYGAVLSGVTGYSVTVSSTSSADFLVGVCKHATITTGAYGWLVTKGFAPVEMGADYSAAAGSLLELSDDGTFDIVSNTTGNVGACGKAMEAIASGASGSAFIKCI